MTTSEEATGTGATGPESGPILIPWRLAIGNFVSVTWLNWQGRARETIGQVTDVNDEFVVIRPRTRKRADEVERINHSRITGVEVIKEGDEAIELRRRAWSIVKRAASHINRRSSWEREDFLRDMQKVLDIFPELRER